MSGRRSRCWLYSVLFLALCITWNGRACASGHPRMIDALGDTLPAGPWPRRIVSLSPNLTEILFACGVDSSRIVGVTRYCDYPPAARRRPQIGGILDPSLESIEMRSPDLVLAARGNPVETLGRIRSLGFPVFAFDDRTGLVGIARIIRTVVDLTGPENRPRADSLLQKLDGALDSSRARSDSIPVARRRRVYYVDPEHPEWSAGPGSHVDDLIRLAGGVNVVRGGGAWPQVSAERLALMPVDSLNLLIALPEGARRAEVLHQLEGRPGWSMLLRGPEKPESGFRDQRGPGIPICWIDAGKLLRPGPRLFDALAELASCLYPDRAPSRVPAARSGR